MKYTAIVEWCDNEGEKWITFVLTEDNVDFISKLKELCTEFENDDEYLDASTIKVLDRGFTEAEVDFLIETDKLIEVNGYDLLYQKFDGILDISLLNSVKDAYDFLNSFYKRNFFNYVSK